MNSTRKGSRPEWRGCELLGCVPSERASVACRRRSRWFLLGAEAAIQSFRTLAAWLPPCRRANFLQLQDRSCHHADHRNSLCIVPLRRLPRPVFGVAVALPLNVPSSEMSTLPNDYETAKLICIGDPVIFLAVPTLKVVHRSFHSSATIRFLRNIHGQAHIASQQFVFNGK